MSGDYTRFTFEPRDNYGGVLMQQGRVTLDADWNEGVEALDRRWRAETMDIVGRAVVMRTDLDTDGVPSAFRILLAGTSFTIGRGRAYIDGLLAENHGAAPQTFDVPLNEVRGTQPYTYETQPYFPFPPAMPASGTHVAYVDVWEREVTALEDPAIVEKAVGVDTATRIQTVWQVKLLAVPVGTTCATDLATIPAWVTATASSGGRLTSGSIPGAVSNDPCVIAAAGGYRGTENRLYRVEIHTAGAPGTAQFKWSRDNASVVSAVTALSTTQPVITVSRIGRDDRLRFRNGDWVEITNDIRELHGVAGEIRQIVADPDEVTLQLTLSSVLPTGAPTATTPYTFDAADPRASHMRVKLWHQQGIVRDTGGGTVANLTPGSSGVIPVPVSSTTTVILEDGVTVSFSLDAAGGQFKVGDYWVFEARTIDGSVAPLNAAPPRGIHHHFAKLAVITLPATVTDCRTVWPPDGGCCLVVRPGQSIQNAINSLPPAGGCVCLKAGVHVISAPIAINRSNVVLHGDSPGAIVEYGTAGALDISVGASGIVVHDIRFTLNGMGGAPPASITGATRVRIENCTFGAAGYDTSPPVGVLVTRSRIVELINNTIGTCSHTGILVLGHAGRFTARGNTVAGTAYELNLTTVVYRAPLGQYGIHVETAGIALPLTCQIEGNTVVDFLTGILVERGATGTAICGNRIVRDYRGAAVNAPGAIPPDIPSTRAYLDDDLFYAIDCAAPDCLIEGNDISLPTALGGIRLSAPGSRVRANTLIAMDRGTTQLQPCGIYCTGVPGTGDIGAHRCDITDNRIEGPQLALVISRATGVRAYGNHIMSTETLCWRGVLVDDGSDTVVESNRLSGIQFGVLLVGDNDRNRVIDNSIENALHGMSAGGQADLEIRGNSVRGAAHWGILVMLRRGTCLISHNRIANCGWLRLTNEDLTGFPPVGIFVFAATSLFTGVDAHATVESCDISDMGIAPDGTVAPGPVVGIWMSAASCEINGCRVGYANPALVDVTQEHRSLFLVGPLHWRVPQGGGFFERDVGGATVVNNVFQGPGRHHLVEFERRVVTDLIEYRFEQAAFSNNRCEHLSGPDDGAATVLLNARNPMAIGNHIKTSERIFGLRVVVGTPHAVVLLGNISNRPFSTSLGQTRPTPINAFNFIA